MFGQSKEEVEEVEEMNNKLLDALSPTNDYTTEEFMKEYNTDLKNDSMQLEFKYVNKSSNPDPEYATIGSSAFDLRANLNQSVTLDVGDSILIPTGLHFQLPTNFEIQVRPRSGLAYKHGITVLNSPGTIDADYRGDIGVILINHGKKPFVIEHGERIAQAVIATVMGKTIVNLNRVESIDNNTERGDGGFGSTGIK